MTAVNLRLVFVKIVPKIWVINYTNILTKSVEKILRNYVFITIYFKRGCLFCWIPKTNE